MELQLALDRMSVADALILAGKTGPFIDYVEVGTSPLIYPSGKASAMRRFWGCTAIWNEPGI
ncbi:hypothetical protein CEF21_06490 [Bacillus sp. FJAT-42376]|uniref:hypothetical protein n=1 Tax=Bacillus sp. FJAT-42376 TaxID=2014076 RepID=UPI000F4EFE2F|nr:hypothetical protein [Bacillus sp. FJAT-42376]AZB41966.1 hypothetical protein CEF21_06490 [Bacillus sp. FJAT-42376]